jgi:hypothetical protein
MICPFCQHDLDTEALACPRCHASYPRGTGMTFPFKLRAMLVSGGLLFVGILVMNAWVLHDFPSREVVSQCIARTAGGNCMASTRARTVSGQLSDSETAPGRSDAVQALLSQWDNHTQGTQNNPWPQGRRNIPAPK